MTTPYRFSILARRGDPAHALGGVDPLAPFARVDFEGSADRPQPELALLREARTREGLWLVATRGFVGCLGQSRVAVRAVCAREPHEALAGRGDDAGPLYVAEARGDRVWWFEARGGVLLPLPVLLRDGGWLDGAEFAALVA